MVYNYDIVYLDKQRQICGYNIFLEVGVIVWSDHVYSMLLPFHVLCVCVCFMMAFMMAGRSN